MTNFEISQHIQQHLFHGISCILDRWTAIRMAIEGEWGGYNTEAKVSWFKETMTGYVLEEGKRIDIQDIEDILENVMLDEFHIELDDSSARQVASKIYELYDSLMKGSINVYDEVVKVKITTPIKKLVLSDDSSGCDSHEEELINQEN